MFITQPRLQHLTEFHSFYSYFLKNRSLAEAKHNYGAFHYAIIYNIFSDSLFYVHKHSSALWSEAPWIDVVKFWEETKIHAHKTDLQQSKLQTY